MTARLAVFGNPVEHSRSPSIHEAFGKQAGIDLHYEKVLVNDGDFEREASEFMKLGIGFNITVPFKSAAWQFVDHCSDKAAQAQAVNTISRDSRGILTGDNTDGEGLVRDLVCNLGWEIESKHLLVLGGGGAVSGVLGDLLEAGPSSIDILNRTHEKATILAQRFGDPRLRSIEKNSLAAGYDLIINGTSAGLSGEVVDLPAHIVGDQTCCYDMIYGDSTTSFNHWCLKQASCQVSDGHGMLVEQAALAFRIWFGIDVNTTRVIKLLREQL